MESNYMLVALSINWFNLPNALQSIQKKQNMVLPEYLRKQNDMNCAYFSLLDMLMFFK